MKITITAMIERQRARFYITIAKLSYTKIQALFKKQDNFCYVFIYKMYDTLLYAIFHEIFEVGIYIQKA